MMLSHYHLYHGLKRKKREIEEFYLIYLQENFPPENSPMHLLDSRTIARNPNATRRSPNKTNMTKNHIVLGASSSGVTGLSTT